MRRDRASLQDVVDAATLLGRFIEGMDASAFKADLKTRAAALHQLLLMGEAVKRLSPELRDSRPG